MNTINVDLGAAADLLYGWSADDLRDAVDDGREIGEIAWSATSGIYRPDDVVEFFGRLPGWPECECCGCDCTEPAETTDDGGVPVCSVCNDYAIDEDGEVICMRSDPDRLEVVTESCGAGGQTRSYVRIRPPEMPDTDPDGEWALYWETAGDDEHVVARFASRADAEQAVAAQDWPPPGDHTRYLCGHGVRRLVDGEWTIDDD